MSTLIGNLNMISSIKDDIREAISAKGVDMTSVPFSEYASKIGEIETGGTFVTETLSVSANNTYYPGQGVDGFSEVVVNVPQSVEGYTLKQCVEKKYYSSVLSDPTVSYVGFGQLTGINGFNWTIGMGIASYAYPKIIEVNFTNCSLVFEYGFYYQTELLSVNLPTCTFVGESAFLKCSRLQTVNIPECVSIRYSAFVDCTALQSISLASCKTIDNGVFVACGNLSSINLPVCGTIGNSAFSGCRTLSTIYLGNSTVCTIGSRTFYGGCPISSRNGSIYVPSSLVEAYKSAQHWSSLSTIILPIPE